MTPAAPRLTLMSLNLNLDYFAPLENGIGSFIFCLIAI